MHGIPGSRRLEDGDILSIDCGAIVDGFHGDSALTIPVGETSALGEAVTACAEDSLYAAIEQCHVGNRMGDVSAAAQACAEARGLAVVREYVGHGIGRDLHEEPSVPNYGEPGRGLLLRKGPSLGHRADGERGRLEDAPYAGRMDRRHRGRRALRPL